LAVRSGSDSIRAILLDIEGTTTPIDFVYGRLFPYARQHFRQFLLEHGGEPSVRKDIEDLRAQHQTDVSQGLNPPQSADNSSGFAPESATAYSLWLMDRDSKCSPLKSLQGRIWQEGYRKRDLRGEVYGDVPPALARWSSQGKLICIFSSGSVLAQQLLFSSTAAGDLTRFLHLYFDTTIGPKNVPRSYSRIAEMLSLEPRNILFISDVPKELDAARQAGMQTALCLRTGSAAGIPSAHPVIHTFEETPAES